MRFYCLFRESSDPQMAKKGLARQWRQVRRFAETWDGAPHEISPHSVQISESASKGNRLEWQEAVEQGIEYYHQGVIDGFLFPEVDRETRNPVNSIPILNLALGASVPIYFAQEQLRLDPKDPEAINRYTDAMSKSCAYLATMVQKCRGGRFDRADIDRKLPSNTKMFAFDIVEGKRVPNQAQAGALREAAQIALKEGRLAPAAKWLDAQGFQTTVNKPFTTVTLHGLFRNQALIGETVINFKEKTVVLHHEPILDVATFEALQAMLNERRLRAPKSEVFYVLSGLLSCGCGAKFEPTKTGASRYYYRCSQHCGENAWRKDELEWEVNETFCLYLERRESQQRCIELAEKSRAKLQQDLEQVERDLAGNNQEWHTLLNKELADYPDIIIADKKRELTAERQALLQAKDKLETELEALPHVDPAEVEKALDELARPLQGGNIGGYAHAMSWERSKPGTPHKLSEEEARRLRELLLRLSCRITIIKHSVFISGKLPLSSGRVKQAPL